MTTLFELTYNIGNNSNPSVKANVYNEDGSAIDKIYFGKKEDFKFEFFRSDEAKKSDPPGPLDVCEVLYKDSNNKWSTIYYLINNASSFTAGVINGEIDIENIKQTLYEQYYKF